MIFLETEDEELFAELANIGWEHPISTFVRPGEPMLHSLRTIFKCTTITVAMLPSTSSRPTTSSEFIGWLATQIEQAKA